MSNAQEPAAQAGQVERRVSVPPPTKGLTFRNGKREANVHNVKDGIVFYGVYLDGDDWPAGLYQATLDQWDQLATQAVEHGAEFFTMVRANVELSRAHKEDERSHNASGRRLE